VSSGSAVIASWSQLWAGHSPEEFAVTALAAADALAEYDVPGVRRAWRRAIEQALPDGFHLRGNTFHGPAEGLRPDGGRGLVDAQGRTALQLHQAVLEEAVGGPGRFPAAQLWVVASQYRLSEAGQRVYGRWETFTGDTELEDTVAAALDVWGRGHVQELADTGRWPVEAVVAAAAGLLGTVEAVTSAVAASYRQALAGALPSGFVLDDADAVRGPHPMVEGVDVTGAVHGVDLAAVIAAVVLAPRVLLTAQEVAEVIGAATADSARHTLSRWGVTAATYVTGDNGRVQARYDADQVRAAQAARPGRGRRAAERAAAATGRSSRTPGTSGRGRPS